METLKTAFETFWAWVVDLVQNHIVTAFQNITARDIVDMVLMALLLYSVYCFTRTRRAGRLLLGLYLVVLASAVVYLTKLPTLAFVVRLFAASVFFCVVVIFQPEFRDALERLGNGRLLSPFSDRLPRRRYVLAKKMTDEVVDAVFKMSESRTGALIVFEGLTKLGDYTRSGKVVNADVTSHLLRNIFFENAPLHDGAVVIRDMKIYAASCVLPSSSKGDLDFGGMGTRHRAAVGVTEVSDALVVVVSEQTGIVSVAQNGHLVRGISKQMLQDILMTYVAGRTYLNYKRANMQESYRNMLERVAAFRTERQGSEGVDGDEDPSVVEILPIEEKKNEGGEES